MKILYYSPHPQLKLNAPTGYGTHMREMIGAFRNKEIEVRTLIAGDIGGEDYGQSRPSKLSALKRIIPAKVWETIKDYRLIQHDKRLENKLLEIINDFQPDLIYERVAYLQNSGVKVARELNLKHVSEINAPYPEERVYFSGNSFFISQAKDHEREILVKSDLITTVSYDLKVHLEKKLIDIESKIMVVPNSVNPDEINHSTELVNQIKEAYKLEDQTIIGFVGSIFPYHGVDLMIKAFSQLKSQSNLKLLIVGDGEALSALKSLARKLQILGSCIFTGSVPHREVYAYIECMHICCMPNSNWYGSPVKIFEYGLMKKPVIAPNVGPVRDVMKHEETAILVAKNEDSLKVAFQRLINSPELRNQLAESWHRKVLTEYTWDVAATKVIKACT